LVNWVSAALAVGVILLYVVFYTMILKRRTSQNIVWGGIAGCMPVLIGWSAVTGTVSWTAVLLFLVIFFWTPPHFWALALFMKSDYHEARVPMLTVTHGRPATRRHIFAYTLVLAPFAIWLGLTSVGGPIYLAAAVVLNALFIHGGWQILRRDEAAAVADGYAVEKRVFKLSLHYLFLHFVALLVQNWVGAW
ncbi:UbiA family prenyltransferase, partial [Bifidobacterium longum]|uniref:UbiA family prenyltransferase n=1 Tax=Bifidobacterium longum TaxID=216816 RepID=UPI002570CCDF